MAGLVNATQNENLLWNIERTVTNVFIPLLNANGMGDKAGGFSITLFISVLQTAEPVESKLFETWSQSQSHSRSRNYLFNKYFLQSVWRMLG